MSAVTVYPKVDTEKELAALGMLDNTSPEKPAGVSETSEKIIVHIKDFDPTFKRLYVKKPKPSKFNATCIDGDIYYIFDVEKNRAAKLELNLLKTSASGFYYKYKYNAHTDEEMKAADFRAKIKDFQLPLRLWNSAPSDEEKMQESKLNALVAIIKVLFFRWKRALGKESADWDSLQVLKNMDKIIKYKRDDKTGDIVEGRGPTLTVLTYKKEAPGKQRDADGMLYPEEWLVSSLCFRKQGKAAVPLKPEEIRQYMPEYMKRQDNFNEEGERVEFQSFQFDVEPVVAFSKARWAAGKGTIARHVTQVLLGKKRNNEASAYTGFAGLDGDDDDDEPAAPPARSSKSSADSWASMGAAVPKVEAANDPATAAALPNDPVKAATEAAGEEDDEEEEEEDDEEDDEEEEEAPARKPGIIASAPELTPAPVTGAPPPGPSKARRAPPKK